VKYKSALVEYALVRKGKGEAFRKSSLCSYTEMRGNESNEVEQCS